jgi:hypothetical protein
MLDISLYEEEKTTMAKPTNAKNFDDRIITFHKFVIVLRENNSYLLSKIGSADQTSIC